MFLCIPFRTITFACATVVVFLFGPHFDAKHCKTIVFQHRENFEKLCITDEVHLSGRLSSILTDDAVVVLIDITLTETDNEYFFNTDTSLQY